MRLEFDGISIELDPDWTAQRWDEHPDYRNGLERLDGSKAVDVVASKGGLVVLLEGKDFRYTADDWNDKIKRRALATPIAQKVRDTLAGLVALCRAGRSPWKHISDSISSGTGLVVVLWLERPDAYYLDKHRKDELANFKDVLKQKLAWLPNHVLYVSGSKHVGVPGIRGV